MSSITSAVRHAPCVVASQNRMYAPYSASKDANANRTIGEMPMANAFVKVNAVNKIEATKYHQAYSISLTIQKRFFFLYIIIILAEINTL